MKNQQGQVLLITIMLLATALTIVLTTSFRSTTETQITKQEEESQKALAAAEAGIEARLQSTGTDNIDIGTLNLGAGISGTAVDESVINDQFLTPLLQTDEQYTFYLADYDVSTNTFSNYFDGQLSPIYFDSSGGTNCATRDVPALELTFISSTNNLTRKIIEPCSSGKTLGTTSIGVTNGGTFQGKTFTYKTSDPITISEDIKIIIVRNLFASTKIGIQGSTNLKLQGKTVVSEARTPMASKKVQLFQSYPQIPTEFFVTSF